MKFGTSGIRGVFQAEIDVNLVNKLVESIVLGKLGSKFLIGHDVRKSHNPPDYCGIKIFDSKGVALSEETENMLQEYNSDYKYQSRKFGKISYNESTKIDYKLKLLDLFSPAKKKYKILVDCAIVSIIIHLVISVQIMLFILL